MNPSLRSFVPAIVWGLVILALSLTPGENMPDLSFLAFFQVDKLAHFICYAILVALILLGFYRRAKPKSIPTVLVIFTLIFAISYGIVIECMQFLFFPGRYFEILDIIANIIGSLSGLLSLRVFYKTNI